jgi:hypothetical protein
MRVETDHDGHRIFAESYALTFPADRPFVYVAGGDGSRIAELFVLSGVHPLHARDDTVSIEPWQVRHQPEWVEFSLRARSSTWEAKTYRFVCTPRGFTYEIEVEGSGCLAEVDFFGGYYSGHLRWGSGFFWSGQTFLLGFNPEPNAREINYFAPASCSTINLAGVPLPGRDDWFFTPPPFCFAFQLPEGWLGLGFEAQAGENRFVEARYNGQDACFYLALSYEGHTRVDGRYRLPAVGFYFAPNEYQALVAHVDSLRAAGAVAPAQAAAAAGPRWWQEPLFCGWGAQCALARREGGRSPDYARQPLYEEFLRTLQGHELRPGTVVIDDKWQLTYGENQADPDKWPDLAGFIAGQHAAGRRVLLWLKAWDPEGLPDEECITNAAGLPITVDPTNPAFEARLRASVRHMLSADGYDADGFKVDFTARIPSGPAIRLHGDLWGLELMKHYLWIVHHEAKAVKAEALIVAHTTHPYLADVVDMIRLNDINVDRNVMAAMTHRARVARIACPEALIDADNWPIPNLATWREYVRLQPELGVPSLYYASHIDATQEPLEAEDYRLVQEVWAEYRVQLAPEPGQGPRLDEIWKAVA